MLRFAQLGDIGHGALVVVGFDPLPDLDDEVKIEAFFGHFVGCVALIHQQK